MGQVNADFNVGETSACGSLQVNFFDQSTTTVGSIIDYSWDLAIANSSLQNPGAIYNMPGTYTVCLTVTSTNGDSDTECKTDLITIFESPTALFDIEAAGGCAPITATYTNLSTSANGQITNLLWDVGGSTNIINSADPNQIITTIYNTPGSYGASLTVIDEQGCQSTYSNPNPLQVNGIRPVKLDVETIESCQLPWEIQFLNLDIVDGVDYTWDFGNGQTYSGPNPPIAVYQNEGSFDITVYSSNGSCKDTTVFENVIDTDPEISFDISSTSVCNGEAVVFTDVSSIIADSLLWSFGDGNLSTEVNPSHIYNQSGCYDITLIRYTRNCSDTTSYTCLEVLPVPIPDYTIENQFNCILPTTITVIGNNQQGDWQWSLDNGEVITNDTAIFEIIEYGEFTLSMTYTAENGCITNDDQIPIIIKQFEAFLPSEGPSGCAPLSFSLQDSTDALYNIVSWEWSIEDGLYTSNSSIPSFTIADTGTYDLQLIVTNDIGCEYTIDAEDYIKIGLPVEVNFVGDPLIGCRSEVRNFTDLTIGHVDEWEWIFEGDTIYKQNPLYEFEDEGAHDVTLNTYHNGCKSTLTFFDYIIILEPDPEFALIYNCDDPYTVSFENRTTGADSLIWTIQTGPNPSDIFTSQDSMISDITFPDRGKYVISLYAKNFTTGCEYDEIDTIRIVDPIASYTVDTLRGCAPFEVNIENLSQDGFSYQYLTDSSSIDTTSLFNPIVTFTEGGLLTGPTLIVTDIHECRDTFQIADTVIVNKLDAGIIYNPVACIPATEEYLDNSTDLLGNIISWEWSVASGAHTDDQPNTSYTYDTDGVYDLSLKVVDDWGCKDSLIIQEAVIASILEPDFAYDSLGCTFAPIQFQVTSTNTFVDEYLWEFGDGNTSNEKNPAHIYENEGLYSVCLTLFDYRGCDKTICKDEIILIQDPIADFIGDPLFSTCPPMLSNFTNNSINALSYTWDFGDGSGQSSSINPGHVYTVPGSFDVSLVATWTPLCKDTLIIEDYVVVEGPTAEFELDYTLTCIPQPISVTAISDEPYQFIWDFGNGVLDSVPGLVTSNSTNYEYNETGTFAPKVIVIDDNGCTRSFSGDQIRVDNINLEMTVSDSVFCGIPNNIQLENTSTGTTNDVLYSWLLDGPDIISSLEKAPVLAISTPGIYDVQLFAHYGGCKDTITEPQLFEVGTFPSASFNLDQAQLCKDVDVQLYNTSSINYGFIESWEWLLPNDSISDLENPVFTSLNESGLDQDITLIAVSNLGCTDTISSSYTIQPSLIADAGPDHTICIGDITSLLGSITPDNIGGSFGWNSSASLSCTDCLEPIVNVSDSSTFVLTAIHPNGCISIDSVNINVVPVPGPTLEVTSDSIICAGDTAIITVTNFDPTYTYVWNPFVLGLDCYQNCEVINASPTVPTYYPVGVLNQYGCNAQDTVFVDVETTFEEFLDDRRAVCENESIHLYAFSGSDPVWQTNDDLSCTTCDTVIATLGVASEYFHVTVSSPLGCRYTDSVWVEVIPEGRVEAGDDQLICVGETTDLLGSGSGSATWTPVSFIANPQSFESTITLDSSQIVVLTMTDDQCVQEDSLFIEVIAKADIEAVGDTVCFGNQANIEANGIIDKVLWIDGTTQSNFSDSYSDIVSPVSSNNYIAIGYYRTCESDTAVATVKVYEEIKYDLPTYSYDIYLNSDIDITPTYDINRDYEFAWTPSTGLDCDDCADPEIRGIEENMVYEVLITDTESGCSIDKNIDVRFIMTCTNSVIGMPNILSLRSNMDMNGGFGPITENKDEFISLSLYDRWGNQMYETEDVDYKWDGYFNGSPASQGVYVYIMKLICPSTGDTYTVYGDVTLLH